MAYVFGICAVASVGGLLFGYDLSIIGPAILYLKSAFHLQPAAEGMVMGIAAIGCLFGPLLAAGLSDSWGRQKTLFLAAALYGVCAVGSALAGGIALFDCCRFIGGVGVGLSSVVSPMYIAEVAPARLRGRLVTINNLAVVIGSFAAIVVSYFLATSGLPNAWRWMFASQTVPVLVLFAGLCFVPNSPRWLAQVGRTEEARQTLIRLEGTERAVVELQAIEDALRTDNGRWRDLFAPGLRLATFVVIGLGVLQQITGASILFAYAPMVLQKAGFVRDADAIGATVIVQLWNVAATLAALWMVDRVGRRPLLLVGAAGMSAGLLALGWAFQCGWSGVEVLLLMLAAIGMYLISFAPLVWLLMSEIFPARLRGKGMALGSLAVWASFYLGLQLFPMLEKYFDSQFHSVAGVYYLFAAVSALAFLFCWKLAPETRGKTLEEISQFCP